MMSLISRINNPEAILRDYITKCVARGSSSPKTTEIYCAGVTAWARFLEGRNSVDMASCIDVEDYRAELLKTYKARTVAVRLAAVSALYKAFIRAGIVQVNPAAGVKAPRPESATTDAIMQKLIFPDQLAIVLAKLKDDLRGRRDRAIMLTLYLLGLRVSEVVNMRAEGFREGVLKFIAKGSRERALSVPDALQEAFYEHLATRTEGPMFPGAQKGHISVRNLQKMITQRFRKAGIPVRSPHAFRHSCATFAAIGGASPFAIQDHLGHDSQKTTAIYTTVAGRFMESPGRIVERQLIGVRP